MLSFLRTRCAAVCARPAARRFKSASPADPEVFVRSTIKGAPVVVFSKSYCPYCSRVKNFFDDLGVRYTAVELDQVPTGTAMQDALKTLTGQSTVPNVFVNHKHIGGCDKTLAMHKQGTLQPLLKEAGFPVKEK
eukprot:RCo042325